MNLRSVNIKTKFFINFAGLVVNKASGFLFMAWATYAIRGAEFVLFALSYSLYLLLVGFVTAGIMEVLLGEIKREDFEDFSKNFINKSITNTIPIAILIAGLMHFFNIEIDIISISFIVLCAMLSGYSLNLATLERLKEEHFSAQIKTAIIQIFGFVMGVILYSLSNSSPILWLGVGLGQACGLMLTYGAALKGRKYFIKSNISFIKIILPYSLVSLFVWFSGYGLNFITINILGGEEVAAYTKIITIASILQLVSLAFNQVWVPIQLGSKPGSVASNTRQNGLFYISMAIFFGFVSIFLSSIMHIFGGEYSFLKELNYNSRYYLLVLSSYILLIPGWNVQYHFFLNKSALLFMNVTIISSAIGLMCWIYLMYQMGGYGIYIGLIVYNLIRTGAIVAIAYRSWRVKTFFLETTIIFSIVMLLYELVVI